MLGGCAHASPGDPAFAVLGDAPYTEFEAERLDALIDEMNREPLAFVVHVGDIGSAALACSDEWLLARKAQFARIRHPFVLIPGDNEWTDCKDQAGRLRAWRHLFCYGKNDLKIERQSGEFCEHVRWEAEGWIFVALNVPGTNNNVRRRQEHDARMAAVFAWLDEAVALARGRKGLVVLMQADPFVTTPRDGYGALREKLSLLGERMPGRLVLIHGDTHVYRDDEPIDGMRRIEVWGSPFVAWMRLTIGELSGPSPR